MAHNFTLIFTDDKCDRKYVSDNPPRLFGEEGELLTDNDSETMTFNTEKEARDFAEALKLTHTLDCEIELHNYDEAMIRTDNDTYIETL